MVEGVSKEGGLNIMRCIVRHGFPLTVVMIVVIVIVFILTMIAMCMHLILIVILRIVSWVAATAAVAIIIRMRTNRPKMHHCCFFYFAVLDRSNASTRLFDHRSTTFGMIDHVLPYQHVDGNLALRQREGGSTQTISGGRVTIVVVVIVIHSEVAPLSWSPSSFVLRDSNTAESKIRTNQSLVLRTMCSLLCCLCCGCCWVARSRRSGNTGTAYQLPITQALGLHVISVHQNGRGIVGD